MKKSLILGIILAVVIVLIGGFFLFKKDRKSETPGSVENEAFSQDDGNLILDTAEKIKSAMLSGRSLECTAFPKDGNRAIPGSHFFTQGKKYRSEYQINGEKFISISDGETIYNWSEKTKKGTVLKFDCLKEFSSELPEEQGVMVEQDSPEDLVSDSMKINCQTANNVDFSVPGDVILEDQCEILKKQTEALKNLGENLPAGFDFEDEE